MQKEKEYHQGAKGSAAALDGAKMVKKYKQREQKFQSKHKEEWIWITVSK